MHGRQRKGEQMRILNPQRHAIVHMRNHEEIRRLQGLVRAQAESQMTETRDGGEQQDNGTAGQRYDMTEKQEKRIFLLGSSVQAWVPGFWRSEHSVVGHHRLAEGYVARHPTVL